MVLNLSLAKDETIGSNGNYPHDTNRQTASMLHGRMKVGTAISDLLLLRPRPDWSGIKLVVLRSHGRRGRRMRPRYWTGLGNMFLPVIGIVFLPNLLLLTAQYAKVLIDTMFAEAS